MSMTALITAPGLGVDRSSAELLGAAGQLGQSAIGQANDNVYINAATGNLVVQATDQVLIGQGVDADVARTYNSLGALSQDNGAQWSDADGSQVLLSTLTGTLDTTGSTIQRVTD